MKNNIDISLEKVIDFDEFSKIQSELSIIVDFSTVTVNTDGVPITALSNFTEFCQLIRSSQKGKKACVMCDQQALDRSVALGHSIAYDCHCGLKDCAAPIIVDGVLIGGVLGGQVLISEQERSNIDTDCLSKQFDIDQDALIKAVERIEIVPEVYLQRCLQFYSFIASYVAEKGYKALIQQKLSMETVERVKQQQIATDQMLKRIQAQMNPHFLFNALNSIARTSLIEGATATEQLIYNLSSYLRYTVKNTSSTPTIAEEYDNLENYLNIQKARFGNRISYQIEVDPSLKECRIPSMTLQPLVENSLIHGLKNCTEHGIIRVNIEKYKGKGKNDIIISIYDNGCGMPKDIINLFHSHKEINNTTLGLGLTNTQLRINTLYGPDYGISIDSKPNEYTQLTIILPGSYH